MKAVLEKTKGKFNTVGFKDVRTALDDKNLDAISIATPNHWHSMMTIWGAQAGKHVYVEKPMSHDVYEGRIAMEAQKKYGVVVQHGTQNRSDAKRVSLANSKSRTATAASREEVSAPTSLERHPQISTGISGRDQP